MPDLRHLRVFAAVARERNFTRAAEQLHLAQQAVSKTVGQLEAELGVELLHRTTREVELTPAGRVLLEDATGVLAAADAAFARARAIGTGEAGVLRVGVSPAIPPPESEAVVAAFRRARPGLEVHLWMARPRDVVSGLHARELELALVRTVPTDPALASEHVADVPMQLAVPEGHPLAARRDTGAALRDLDGHTLVVFNPPGTPYTDTLTGAIRAAGAEVALHRSGVVGGDGLADVVDGHGVALASVLQPGRAGVVLVSLDDPPALPLHAVWLRAAAPPGLRELLRAAATVTPPAAPR
ncbi:MAG TPA: LysR substrate-binding domain-containing protein [Solirubrobacteraceae bacterium]|nr:LysR substrate-binding domain-containing protein [Solirubrobacteraceae bacterium]